MTKTEYRLVLNDLIYLASCAVSKVVPDKDRIKSMNLPELYKAAEYHLLCATTACALESAGVCDHAFTQAKAKAIRKVALMDAEMAGIFAEMDKAGIWHMPLKGTVLKDYYPQFGMREMSDHDILFDPSRADDVKEIMVKKGYDPEHFGAGNHDCYYKEPVCNFEMHRSLFGKAHDAKLHEYYLNVKERLLQDEEGSYSYHFSPEDFYVYMIAHEYKHYSGGGTGLRSLLDTYVFLKKHQIDMDYVTAQMESLGIAEYEVNNRRLSMHLFSGGSLSELTDTDKKMLGYIFDSGTYGTVKHNIENQVAKKGRFGYFLSRTFLSYDLMKGLYPVLKVLPVLLPVFWVWRLVSAFIFKRDKMMYQIKTCFSSKKS